MRRHNWIGILICISVGIFVTVFCLNRALMADWRTANRESIGIAPNPEINREAIVQVYSARTYGWRGSFGTHSWFAVKPKNAPNYTVYEVIGWRLMRGLKVLAISHRPPDGRWFGNDPVIIGEIRGDHVDEIIKRLDITAKSYPYMKEYRMWPGPNSNTFTAHVARAIPELTLDLPPTAIGKDFIPGKLLMASSPSGTGYQVSFFGILGVLIGKEEGLEINLLGLTFGVDPLDLAIKLPLVGRLEAGFSK